MLSAMKEGLLNKCTVNKRKYLLSGYCMLGSMPGKELSESPQSFGERRPSHELVYQFNVRSKEL